jgi:hypothetical protein
MSSKVCVIGLDCAAPELVFDLWADRLPNLRRVMERGVYGPLESATPPITVPAWMCMTTSQDPGSLGIYGFRNRLDHSYDKLGFVNSSSIKGVSQCASSSSNRPSFWPARRSQPVVDPPSRWKLEPHDGQGTSRGWSPATSTVLRQWGH